MIGERMRQARDLIRPVLEAANEPLATTQVAELSGGWQVRVYSALRSLERDGVIVRAGRVGSAARAEVLWVIPRSVEDGGTA